MPKVTDAYREQRREQILAAAWDLFAHNGFHNTSMAQIIAGSKLSAGAVYLYFRSKDDLIVATAEKALSAAHGAAGELLAAPEAVSPGAAMNRMLGRIETLHQAAGEAFYPVAIQAWSEAVRNPVISKTARRFFAMLLDDWAELLLRWQAAGHPLAGPPPELARMVTGAIQGYLIQRVSFGVEHSDDYLAALGDRLTAMVSA